MIDLGQFRHANYRGYESELAREYDDELVRTGPGTPCGEYLRQFWHPVFLARDLGDRPAALRILGEDLVLFRTRDDRIGLVHKHCPHRQASFEFGTCEERGIRCCYHGWLFGIDGELLETPGQPVGASEKLCAKVRLGAYPAFEYKGLIFAYMGPRDAMPEFPIYDSFDFENMDMVPYRAPFRCNWLQVLDAIVDPIHTAFLHSNISRTQFSEGFGVVGEMDFFQRDAWLLGCATRRVDDNIWLRINELVLPNFTQAGSAFAADGTKVRYYGRSSFTRWVVPVDDDNTLAIAWANFGERGDPPEWNTPEGPELIEQGEVFDRTYEQRQQFPGDAEAVEGMGKITVHANENLAPSDKGVALMRRLLRSEIRRVAQGEQPLRAENFFAESVPTYGGDTVLSLPQKSSDESALLSELAHDFVSLQYEADGMAETQRVEFVTERLKQLESQYRERADG